VLPRREYPQEIERKKEKEGPVRRRSISLRKGALGREDFQKAKERALLGLQQQTPLQPRWSDSEEETAASGTSDSDLDLRGFFAREEA
jgi:hypothetical protein